MIRPRLSPWRPGICRRLTAGATRTLAAPYTVQAEDATTASSTAAAAAAATEGLKRPRAKLVNGRAMATETLDEVRRDVDLMRSKHGMAPGLAVIMVGERRDSAKYMSMKQAVAKSIGFESFSSSLPATATHKEVLECIQRYNGDPRCHGILLQLPVPAHLDPRGLLGAIKVEKDVECFNPTNAGRMTAWRRTVIAPCTPLGVMEMLLRLGVDVRGKHAVVLGESSVVGLPMCLLLNEARATVSMVNKETPNPEEFTRRADIVVAATGVPELVRASWIKPGAVVIDVGMNFVRDDGRSAGFRIAGDVHWDVRQVASIVSPVPGGVGPMTVAMLMRNCANMAFLQSRWGTIAGALHPDLAAENARRMDSAIVDHALGSAGEQSSRSSRIRGGGGGAGEGGDDREEGGARLWAQGGGSSRLSGGGGEEGEGEEGGGVRLEGGARDVEVAREALERAGESITDAELLTIINDSEKNAHDLLSFLELGSSNNQLVDANSSTVGAEAGAGVGPGAGGAGAGMGVGAGAGAVGDKRDRAWPPGFFLGAEKNPGRGMGGGGPVSSGDCGEEMPMKALDEWQREARRAAKARGEAVLPHSKAQDLLLEDNTDRPKTSSKWWVPPSKGEKVGEEEEDSGREGRGAAL